MLRRERSFWKWPIGLLLGITFGLSSCKRVGEISFSYTPGGDIWFKNSVIQLRFNNKMYCKVFKGDTLYSINDATMDNPISRPSHFIIIEGKEVKDFIVDYSTIEVLNIKNVFERGKRLILKGVAKGPEDCEIEKTLTVELYEKYPDMAITYSTYKNLGTKELSIDKVYSNYYSLDASLADSTNEPYDFYSLQGSAREWGEDYIFKINEGFTRENWMGVYPETKCGGGIPFLDLWTKEMGLAIANIEPIPLLIYLPVKVQKDGKVAISILNDVGTRDYYHRNKFKKKLNPGETYKSLKAVGIVHKLDFYEALETYSRLMDRRGIHVRRKEEEFPEEAYEAIWCSWGYESDFKPKDIYKTIPKLKELGIHWIVIDDRWFDRYGDWNPRAYTFPGGEKQLEEFVDSLHKMGFKVKLWWDLPIVQPPEKDLPEYIWASHTPGASDVLKKHPEWLLKDDKGKYVMDNRYMYYLCPALKEVKEYYRNLTEKFIKKWDFDGHKLDAFYTIPPCYNPEHNHEYPEEPFEELPELIRIIYQTTKSLKPNSVTEICNCGGPQEFFQEPYIDQPVTSDPVGSKQVRKRIKVYKALFGPRSPAYADHVELTKIKFTKEKEFNIGRDFASAVGTGGVVGTKFTWPGGPKEVRLTLEKETHWKKWISIYNNKMLSKGEYLNLYDIAYDEPETHTIRKEDTLYYAFYAKSWEGDIELRGLEAKEYQVYDYVNDVNMGKVKGPIGTLTTTFKDFLLIECVSLNIK